MTIIYRDTHDVDLDQLATLFNAYISTVAVLPEYQRRGIGHELIRRLIADRDGIQFVLHANERAYPFYLHLDLGFEPFENVLVRPRHR